MYEVAVTKNEFQKALAQVDVAAGRTVQVEFPLQAAATKTARRTEVLVASLRPVAVATAPMPAVPTPVQEPQAGGKATLPKGATPVAPPDHIIPEALQAPESTPGVDSFTPYDGHRDQTTPYRGFFVSLGAF